MHTLEDLEANIQAVVEASADVYDGRVIRITIDPQASGDVPYQVTTTAEDVPLAGLTRLQ